MLPQDKTAARLFFQPFFIYVVIFATGATGLVYQVAWQKYLSRLIGSDSIATAIILGTFLGGLSAGYFICGRLTTRVKNHFKGYAALEGLIGAWCLCFPATFSLVEDLTLHWGFSPPFFIVLQGFVCSVLLMGLPTLCMGGTIPFLTRGLSKNIATATGVHARVYAVNTAGAFLGTLLSGFYLVPVFGLPLTLMGTAVVNIGAFLYFYIISNLSGEAFNVNDDRALAKAAPAVGPVALSPRFHPGLLYGVAFLSGFYVMTLENILIRISNLSFGSSSYSFSLVVSVFILAIAIGSYLVGRMKDIPLNFLFKNQLLITVCLLIIYLTLDTWPYWAHVIRTLFQSNPVGFWGYYGCLFLVLLVVLVLPVGSMGATVPIAFHEVKRELAQVGAHSGLLLSLNTLGNLLGSLFGGILFYYIANNSRIFLSAVLLAAFSTMLAARPLKKPYRVASFGIAGLAGVLIVLAPFYQYQNFMMGAFRLRKPTFISYEGPALFFKERHAALNLRSYNDGPTATVAVVEFPKEPAFSQTPRSIVVNGKSDSSTVQDIYTIKLLAHFPALLSRSRSQVMVVGLGTGVTAGEFMLYPDVDQVDVAEISPSVVQALDHFKADNFNLAQEPRVRIHTADAFRIMRRSSKKWDIIVSEPSNPWVTGVDQLFTKEFYQLAQEHLTDQGVLVQWFHIYSADEAMMGMIINTLRQQFKQVRLFVSSPGDLILMASNFRHTRQDLERATMVFQTVKPVQASLAVIDIHSLDAILIRELLPPAYITDKYSGYGVQTMDNPRLHYMAGKQFFLGQGLSIESIFTAETTAYHQDYLLSLKYPQWKGLALEDTQMDDLMMSLVDKVTGQRYPMADALVLKANLNGSHALPLEPVPGEEKLINDINVVRGEGTTAIHDGDSYRKHILPLLAAVHRYRNWIVPFSVDGIIALLREGMEREKDPYESNWCALQLALLLFQENANQEEINRVLKNCRKGLDGKILIRARDRGLRMFIESAVAKSKASGVIDDRS